MKQLLKDLKWLFSQKLYIIALSITAVCGYGFAIVTPIIGIDDTAVELYIRDGLEVAMGRWTVYLLNKIFYMAEFTPFMMELVGVILLCIGSTLFALLLRRILGEKISVVACTIFACIFVSNPIISEVYIYYYHDGVDLAYILMALSLMLFVDAIEAVGKKKILPFAGSMLLAWVAVGCYESFLILYILGIIMVLFLRGIAGTDKLTFVYVVKYLSIGALLTVGVVVLRTVMVELLTAVLGLQGLLDELNRVYQRSLLEIFDVAQQQEGVIEFLKMLVKRYWVVYSVNAIVYLPIWSYMFATLVLGIYSVVMAVKRKAVMFPVLFGGMMFTPFLLTIIEGQVHYYRSCQYMPFFTATGVLLLYYAAVNIKKLPVIRYVVAGFALALTFNHAFGLNESFYVDYLKYEDARENLNTVAWEIERTYGNQIPVVFTGNYDTPQPILEYYSVGYGSKEFQWIARITDLVDENLKEKYYQPFGYSYVGEAINPLIQWGFEAFDGTNGQLIKFLKMHGHSFATVTDEEVLANAKEIGKTMPGWPAQGSITLQDGYVLVNF